MSNYSSLNEMIHSAGHAIAGRDWGSDKGFVDSIIAIQQTGKVADLVQELCVEFKLTPPRVNEILLVGLAGAWKNGVDDGVDDYSFLEKLEQRLRDQAEELTEEAYTDARALALTLPFELRLHVWAAANEHADSIKKELDEKIAEVREAYGPLVKPRPAPEMVKYSHFQGDDDWGNFDGYYEDDDYYESERNYLYDDWGPEDEDWGDDEDEDDDQVTSGSVCAPRPVDSDESDKALAALREKLSGSLNTVGPETDTTPHSAITGLQESAERRSK